MNVKDLERKLIAAARAHPPGDRVPHRFERRVMALLGVRPVDRWAGWAGALWRGAAASLAIMLVLSVVTWFNPPRPAPAPTGDLAQAFENTLLAAVGSDTDYSQ